MGSEEMTSQGFLPSGPSGTRSGVLYFPLTCSNSCTWGSRRRREDGVTLGDSSQDSVASSGAAVLCSRLARTGVLLTQLLPVAPLPRAHPSGFILPRSLLEDSSSLFLLSEWLCDLNQASVPRQLTPPTPHQRQCSGPHASQKARRGLLTHLLPNQRHDPNTREHMLPGQALPGYTICEGLRAVCPWLTQVPHEEGHIGSGVGRTEAQGVRGGWQNPQRPLGWNPPSQRASIVGLLGPGPWKGRGASLIGDLSQILLALDGLTSLPQSLGRRTAGQCFL